MGSTKSRVLAAAGILVGIVTLRALRNRRKESTVEESTVEESPVEEASLHDEDELETASDHAKAAAEHARIAATIAAGAPDEDS